MDDLAVFVLLCWRRMESDMQRGYPLGKGGTPNNWACRERVGRMCPQRELCWTYLENWLGRAASVAKGAEGWEHR